jgi:hypothetical protein
LDAARALLYEREGADALEARRDLFNLALDAAGLRGRTGASVFGKATAAEAAVGTVTRINDVHVAVIAPRIAVVVPETGLHISFVEADEAAQQ